MFEAEASSIQEDANDYDIFITNGERYRITGIVALGGCLEFYDFAIFVFFSEIISGLFFPVGMPDWLKTVQTWGIFAAGYLFRPLGGVVLAHFGDLFGRKRVFAFSILLMATSTLSVGLLPTYEAIGVGAPFLLLVMRVLQGIAIGGEVPGAWTFVAEHVPRKKIAWACGFVCAGLGLGILLASSVGAVTSSYLDDNELRAYGWRLPFLLGGIFGLLVVKLRRMLTETPVFNRLRRGRMLVPELPLRAVLKTQATGIARSALATWILSSVIVMTLMMPMVLHSTYGLGKDAALLAAGTSTLFLAVGLVLSGTLLDTVGPKRFFYLFAAFLVIGGLCFLQMPLASNFHLLVRCAVIGLSGSVVSGTAYIMVTSFPARIRYTGVSLAYNASYALFGGIIPIFVAAITSLGSYAFVLYYGIISCSALAMAIILPKKYHLSN